MAAESAAPAAAEVTWLKKLAEFFDSPSEKRNLLALVLERDPELLGQGLLSFAARQTERAPLATFEIYRRIADTPEFYGEALAKIAHRRAEALAGRGTFGERSELFLNRFVQQALDPVTLASMVVAGGAFQGLRLASLSRLLAADAGALTRGWGARGISFGLAFAAEAPAFTAAQHGINTLVGRQAGAVSLGQELASGYLMLGGLRLSASAGAALWRQLGPANVAANGFQRNLFQQGAQFAGITAAHWAEERLGHGPGRNGEALLADSLATLLLFNAAGRLLHGLGGDRLTKKLELRTRALEMAPPSRLPTEAGSLLGPTLAPAADGQGWLQSLSESRSEPNGPLRPTVLLTTGSGSSRPESKPITRNPDLYARVRAAMGEAEFNIYRLYNEINSGWPAWPEVALNSTNLVLDNCRADLTRLPMDHLPTLEKLIANLEQVRTNLELIRNSWDPGPLDRNARDLLGHIYRVPNRMVNYINDGKLETLRAVNHSAIEANQFFNRQLAPFYIVNRDSGETLPPPALNQTREGKRIIRAAKRSWKEDALPFYEYLDSETQDVDIAPTPLRRVLLLGEIPKERGALALNHDVSLDHGVPRPVHRELISESMSVGQSKPIRLRNPDSAPFEYVEAFDFLDAGALLTEAGQSRLRRDFFDRIQPGGIGFWMSRDAQATELVVQTALDHHIADVILGSRGADLPLRLPSAPQDSKTNYVFFRKLPYP
ncbi:MAG TPA: hypothetical protein VJR29_02490 [bacterium]|nr:hypothetical protein [bacterium]